MHRSYANFASDHDIRAVLSLPAFGRLIVWAGPSSNLNMKPAVPEYSTQIAKSSRCRAQNVDTLLHSLELLSPMIIFCSVLNAWA